jgi:SAM-dependent methyltransferase
VSLGNVDNSISRFDISRTLEVTSLSIAASQSTTAGAGRQLAGIAESIAQRMGCPACHDRLLPEGQCLQCVGCGERFPVAARGALPILLPKHSRCFDAAFAAYERTEPPGTTGRDYRAQRWLPRRNVTGLRQSILARFLSLAADGTVLNIGAGTRSKKASVNCINLDVRPHSNCDVVGDAHCLPFLDGTFDGVYSVSVFEYLPQPFRAAQEIVRVLKPGGVMLCDVPFAFPLFEPAIDLFRYSPAGLKTMFQGLETVEVCPTLGPFAAIASYVECIADALLPGRWSFPLRWLAAWSMQPLKVFDPWLVRRNPGTAASFCILMQKPPAA